MMSLILSGILHAAAIVTVPVISVMGLAGLFSESSLSANIIEEGQEKSYARRSAEKFSGTYSSSGRSAKEGVRPAEEKEEGAADYAGGQAGMERPLKASPQSDQKMTTGFEDPTDEKDKRETVKAAGNDLPEEAAISARLSQPAGLINFKREKFSYDIFWLGIYVGKAVIEAVNEDGITRITSQVHSAPVISTFYKVEDYAESRIKDGRPFNFRIRQREGRYRSDKETIFEADGRKITYCDYLKGTRHEHPVTDGILWDVISGFYYLRTKRLDSEKTVFVDIFDSDKKLNAEVNVLGRESLKFLDRGEIEAIVVKPILKSDGLFQNKGDIRIWLSNDENRTPLKVETRVSIGTVTAELKRVETEK